MLITLCVALSLLAPLAYTTVQFWRVSGSDIAFVKAERRGVLYVRPMAKLISAIADSQSAAVAGRRPDQRALSQAIAAVEEADRAVGESLRVHDTWASLQGKLSELVASPRTGTDAYTAYSEVMEIAFFLMWRVGDTSNLILDPEIDSYYLMESGMLSIPALIADSGRMTDLQVLRQKSPDDLSLARVLVARDRVSASASAVEEGLAKSFDTSASSSIGKDLIDRVDEFRAAVEPLASGAPLVEQPLPPTARDVEPLRARLSQAALELETAALDELGKLLHARQVSHEQARQRVATALVAGMALAAVALLFGKDAKRLWQRRPSAGNGSNPHRKADSGGSRRPARTEGEEYSRADPGGAAFASSGRHRPHARKKTAGASR